jgi:L-alanine-DL-glutamate epimerase-like enolase superfamily enzyme
MSIAVVESRIVTVPIPRGRSLPRVEDSADEPAEIVFLLATIRAADGTAGVGFVNVSGSGRAEQSLLDELFGPILLGADPFSVERIYGQAKQRCPEILRGGAEARAYAALDVAMWDLQARLANLPLWRLLGGARESTPCHVAATVWPGLSADRVVEIARPLLAEGVRGLRVGVGLRGPIKDAGKLQRVRDALGEEVWFGVAGHQGLDLNTALAFGRFLEEEMDADLYADPCPAGDVDAYARLADELEVPVAAGRTLGAEAFPELVKRTRVAVLQPEIGRVGGITPMLKVIDLAELNHRVVMPVGSPEIAVHLACGRSAAVAVDYMCCDFSENFVGQPNLSSGELIPQDAVGLGLTAVPIV